MQQIVSYSMRRRTVYSHLLIHVEHTCRYEEREIIIIIIRYHMFAIVPSKASCTQNYILACQSLNCHPYTFNISFEFASRSCRMKCVTLGCLGGFVQELCCDDQEAELLDVEMKPPSDPQVLRIVKVTVPVPPMR